MNRRLLFVCGKARMRSPTAADLVARWDGVETDFAGVSADADERLSSEQIAWADEIFVMETRQKKRVTSLFGPVLKGKRITVLNVADKYDYMDPALVALLDARLRQLRR